MRCLIQPRYAGFHITSVLQELHWLPDRRQGTSRYPPCSTCYCPAYLAADCQLVSDKGRRQLRSATSRTCVVRWTYSNYGDRCFAAAGPKLWNSLPTELPKADISFQRFNTALSQHWAIMSQIAGPRQSMTITVSAELHREWQRVLTIDSR